MVSSTAASPNASSIRGFPVPGRVGERLLEDPVGGLLGGATKRVRHAGVATERPSRYLVQLCRHIKLVAENTRICRRTSNGLGADRSLPAKITWDRLGNRPPTTPARQS
jgi:hypothetical protein